MQKDEFKISAWALFVDEGLQIGTTEFEASQLEIYPTEEDAKQALVFWKETLGGEDWVIKKVFILEGD